jgi:hypothetical protein
VDLRCVLDDQNEIVEAASPSGLCSATDALGTNFLTAITEATLQEFYHLIIARVRETGRPMTFALRCDTAEVRRMSFVRLGRCTRAEQVCVEVINGTREESPHPVRLALLDPAAERGLDFLTICSWCKQVRMPDGRWVEVDEAMHELRLFEQRVLPRLTHGMCPRCADAVRAEFARQLQDE